MEPCLHSTRPDSKFTCCFRMTETLPVEGQHRFTLTVRQFVNGIENPLRQFCYLGLIFRPRSTIDNVVKEKARSDLTNRTAGDIEGDSRVPGPKSFRGPQPGQSDQRCDSGLLKYVCDQSAVLEESLDYGPGHFDMSSGQHRKSRVITIQG